MLTILGEEYYTIYEVANMLSCTPQCVRNYIKAGKIVNHSKIGKYIYVSKDSIKAFINSK